MERSSRRLNEDEKQNYDNDDDEELDPRIKLELEKLNAATDGINHLETEFGEAQTLFQQMMQDASTQLKSTHHQLGKCVDKSRPYFEALVQAKVSHIQLHDAALSFEQAQTRHFNAKKLVQEAERKAANIGKLDPALQEYLNQGTIEVMETATISQRAWEKHRAASAEFERKQKIMHDFLKSLNKHITKARPYFDLKFALNKQLEFQKKRLEKIQEGLQVSKNAYAETLHNLELISDDIHKSRELKRKALLEPRGEGVGADSDNEESSLPHNSTMRRIHALTLDDISDTISLNEDTESTISEISQSDICTSEIIEHDLEQLKTEDVTAEKIEFGSSDSNNKNIRDSGVMLRLNSEDLRLENNNDVTVTDKNVLELKRLSPPPTSLDVVKTLKERVHDYNESYEIITSHSIVSSPPPTDNIPFDFTDIAIRNKKRFGSLHDLRRVKSECRQRTHSDPVKFKRRSGIF